MATLPENMSVAIDELESAITEMESRLESARAERDEAKTRQVELEIDNANLRRELGQAQERQTATSDILRVINNSGGDLAPVFDCILEHAHRLCGAPCGSLQLYESDRVMPVAIRGMTAPFAEFLRAGYPITDGIREGLMADHPVQTADLAEVVRSRADELSLRTAVELGGIRSMATVPLAKDGITFGRIVAARQEVRPFEDSQIALLQSFAAQAVIAIENARLFNETRESLERQTATADILKVIASSPSDVQPVFDAIATNAKQLIGGFSAAVFRFVADMGYLAAFTPIDTAADEAWKASFPRPLSSFPPFEWVRDGEPAQVADAETVPAIRDLARLRGGFRSVLVTPLMNNGAPIGLVSVTRRETGGFAAHHVQLLQTFADQAVIAIENTRLFNETQEALERQTATAEILKVIASSPSDVQPVFEAIVSSAVKLFEPCGATITTLKDGKLHWAATAASVSGFDTEQIRSIYPIPFDPDRVPSARAVLDRRIIEIPDVAAADTPEFTRKAAAAGGFRSITYVPLIDQDQGIGTIILSCPQTGFRFSERQLAIIRTFADQAVIAIQNVRLFNETREALERQTATADVLKVIASSPSDVQPVFAAIASSAKRLLDGFTATVLHFRGDQLHLVAFTPTSPEADQGLQASFPQPVADFPIFALVRDGATIQFPDTEAENVPAVNRDLGRLRGFRSVLFVPLMNQGKAVGILSVTRTEPGAFADHHVQLLQTFADQAVIAIENTRLFNETQEALERQKASADILRVISSSIAETKPVFDEIVNSVQRLFRTGECSIFLLGPDGLVHVGAMHGSQAELVAPLFPIPIEGSGTEAALRARRVVAYADVMNDAGVPEGLRALAKRIGQNYSVAAAPMLAEDRAIGSLAVGRYDMKPFTERECDLLQSLADQAVIAIENTRLFNETQEALERQTATADILKVIASSPSDTTPVFEAIATSAKRLLGAFSAAVFRFREGAVHLAAFTSINPTADDALTSSFPLPINEFEVFQLAQHGKPIAIPDTEEMTVARVKEVARLRGFRSILYVPLMNGSVLIGLIAVTRVEPSAFAPHHVQLLQTFADQAVIAVENTRLFNETKEALERQTATAEILKVIASSPSDVQPVFDTIVHSANRLIGGFSTAVFRYGDGKIHLAAFTPTDAEGDAFLQSSFPVPLGQFPPYQLTREGAPAELPDTELEPAARDIARARGYRSMLFAPLMNEGEAVGIITVTRVAPGPFGEQHTRLLQMFADQAVIAIKNVGLFNEVQARTEDLAESLQQQTAVGDVLKTISRSTFELQPVLDTLVNSAQQLCDADMAFIMRRVGDEYRAGAAVGYTQAFIDFLTNNPLAVDRGTVTGRAVLERRPVQIQDAAADPEYTLREATALAGPRTMLGVPLLRENEPIGVIVLARQRVEPFTQKQIDLVATFADQAVIAIENVRLFNETREALERQTATSDILKVIASSPSDVQPVFDVIVERAVQLCGARIGRVYRYDGELIHLVGGHGLSVPGREGAQRPFPRPASDDTIVGRVMLSRTPFILADLNEDDSVPPLSRQMITAIGARSQVTMPMLLAGQPIGAITLSWAEPRGYTDQQIALLRTFADQAVIAIENTRLFNEVRQRTEDLSEALQQQTATADVLKVISRSAFDLETVLNTLTESAASLCDADMAAITRPHPDGGYYHATRYNFAPEWERVSATLRLYPERGSLVGRVLLEGTAVQIPDVLADAEYAYPEVQRAGGYRTLLGVPLLRQGQPTGVLFLGHTTVKPFTDKQVELVQTFADQAVIAIENVRLFDEVQAKTRDLEEALQQQTATADVLKVISRSAFDLETVLDALLSSACRLCDAGIGTIRYREGGEFRLAATFGCKPEWIEHFRKYSNKPDRSSVFGRTIVEGHIVHIPDLLADPDYNRPEAQKLMGFRAALGVPLLREGEPFGVINLFRPNVGSFEDRQIELVQTFADQAVIAIENVRLFEEVQAKTRDLSEALTYQTGSANILKVIASSPTDIKPVLNAIVESACELCGAYDAVLRLKKGDQLELGAHHGTVPADWNLSQINPNWTAGRAALEQRPVHVHDMSSSEGDEFPEAQARAREQGHRTILSVPLLQEGNSVGTLTLRRLEVNPFSDKQIVLLQTFADQAVIAIGNVRLFEEVQAKTRDLQEALTYQTGSANILKVIASSPTESGPALKAIVESACELCEANDATIALKDGDDLVFKAQHGSIPIVWDRIPINRRMVTGRAAIDGTPIHIRDLNGPEGEEFPDARQFARRTNVRSLLSVPLLREGNSIGVITLRRQEVNPFTDKQIALLQTFADQAVIAIGNVRLFEEVQAKTRDLSEALTYQTGSADILKVIASSPTDVGPVLTAIVENACGICEAENAHVALKDGDELLVQAQHGSAPVVWKRQSINRRWVTGRAAVDRRPIHVYDLLSPEGDEFPDGRELAGRDGARTVLAVPLMRESECIGVIVIRRMEVRPFSDKQIALLQTFADQAVIAIGNVRLFEEVQARTRELSESLQFQTASSEVLKVISSSPDALQPVLDAIAQTSHQLCGSDNATIVLFRDRKAQFAAVAGVLPAHYEFLRSNPASIDEPGSLFDRMIRQKRTLHFPNVMDDPEISQKPRTAMGGPRALLVTPLLRDGEPVGAIVLRQSHLKPFTPRQIQAIEVFADQAVIAISNVELFEEVQARTRDLTESLQQQTATSEVLQVISSSPGELAPVFEKMLENATRVCGAEFGSMFLLEDGRVRQAALYNAPPAFAAARVDAIRQPHPRGPVAKAIESKQVIHVADVRATPGYLEGSLATVELVELGGARTIVVVPMLRDNEVIGVITVYRQEIRPFDDKQVDLLRNFARQAVIAIENARLLKELRQRTDDLSQSLDDLRTAQDRLVQTEKLASLGQLTAGIAHEIKNPLNFVNNFAALSAELTGELNDALKQAEIGGKIRAEVDELTGLLKDNLEKVVQHGKRADSIVKNMLLHSREGGGEHRPSDINALIDESLNLAYHGARAEKPGFNVTLERDFDADAGQIDLFPQEITRVFLNLISNGFYAVTKRGKVGGEPGFEPTLRASTKNLGEAVEIRIRDNGTGIPPEVKEKMFNPFFTTKPAGEGTGLGLSMSHDIIVKQHGGTIDVDTSPGDFTEFRIVLPRTSNFAEKSRG